MSEIPKLSDLERYENSKHISLILILFVRTVQPNRLYGYVAFLLWIQFASYFWLVYFEIWLSNLNFLLSIRLQHPAFLVLTKQKMCLPQEVGLLICCLSPSLPSRDSVNFSCKFEYWSPIAQTASVFCWFDKQTQDSKPLFKTRWRCLTSTTNTTIINPADYYDT